MRSAIGRSDTAIGLRLVAYRTVQAGSFGAFRVPGIRRWVDVVIQLALFEVSVLGRGRVSPVDPTERVHPLQYSLIDRLVGSSNVFELARCTVFTDQNVDTRSGFRDDTVDGWMIKLDGALQSDRQAFNRYGGNSSHLPSPESLNSPTDGKYGAGITSYASRATGPVSGFTSELAKCFLIT